MSAISSARAAEVARGAVPHRRLERGLVLVEVAVRVGVEPASVALDRLAHLARVRREHEAREVVDVRRDVELPADGAPAARIELRLRGRDRGGAEREPGAAREEALPGERHAGYDAEASSGVSPPEPG